MKSIQPTSPHAHAMYRQQPVERRLAGPNKRVVTLFEAYPQDGTVPLDTAANDDSLNHGRVASLPAPVVASNAEPALKTRTFAKASKAQGKGKGGRGSTTSNLPRGAHVGGAKQLHFQPPPPPPLSLLPAAQRPGPPLLPHQMAGRAPLVVQELRRSALGSLALALCRDTLCNAGLTHSLAVFDVETAGAVTPPPLPKSPTSPPQRGMHNNPHYHHPSAYPPVGGVKDRAAVAPTDAEALLDCLDTLRKSAPKFSEPLRVAHRSGKPLLLGLVNVLGAANAHLADPAAAAVKAISAMPAMVEKENGLGNEATTTNGVAGTMTTGDKENRQIPSPKNGGGSEDLNSPGGHGSSNSVMTHLNNNSSSSSSSSSSSNANGSLLSRSFGATFGSDAERSMAELSLKVEELQSELARQEEVKKSRWWY